mgnify:FL=1
MIYSPFKYFRDEVEGVLKGALSELFSDVKVEINLEIPPPAHGHLSFKTFTLARKIGENPVKVAEKIGDLISSAVERSKMIAKVSVEGGYINFFVNINELAKTIWSSYQELSEKYGFYPARRREKVIVEFLSANPVHPIHIGGARNAFLGDSIARLLEWRGHEVYRHYYVNDMGRQVAIAAYGYKLLGEPKPWTKPDHVIGFIYAITSTLLDLRRYKIELERARALGLNDYYSELLRKIDSIVSILSDLRQQNVEIFDKLVDEFNKREDPELDVSRIVLAYERRDPSVVTLVRKVCELALEGFKETLSKVDITFDSFDWESEITSWSGMTEKILLLLRKTPFVSYSKGTLVFNANALVKERPELKARLGIPDNYEVPQLTLIRSDGTTLYTTRDIAYTIWKFERGVDRVINVIGMDQKVAQLQLKLALIALGYEKYAFNLIHCGYELVSLPGMSMSGRRGRYITLDQMVDEAIRRARIEVDKRSPNLSEDEKRKIAEIVGIGAIKYALISVSPLKQVVFSWDRVLSFERNSGPFIQYAHARAFNILAKAGSAVREAKPYANLIKDRYEEELILMISKFPDVVAEAADKLRPDIIAEYANDLALIFNSFYDKLPVLRAEPKELMLTRLWIVRMVQVVLKNALNLLGIAAPERM